MEPLETELWQTMWREFSESVSSRRGGFRTVTLATVDAGNPEARTVVLRGAEEQQRRLLFHTHLQSPKCRQLSVDPRAVVVGYASSTKLQVRLSGLVTIETNTPLANEHWKTLELSGVRTYCTLVEPSSPSAEPTSNFSLEFEDRAPAAEEARLARKNFALLRFDASACEVLSLRATGHRRLRWTEDARWKAQWLAP